MKTFTTLCRIGAVCIAAVALFLIHAVGFSAEPRAKTTANARPLEEFRFRDDKRRERVVPGTVCVTAQDGGVLVLGQDGGLWTIEPVQLISRKLLQREFVALTPAELGRKQVDELGPEFQVLKTQHYVLCFNTGRDYARWCGNLFERLFTGFHDFWKPRGFELREPEFPLVAIIMADEKQYAAFASRDVGPNATRALGYYAIPSNRMVLYDHTASGGKPARTLAEIERRYELAPTNIATVVHEATHQIAFNSGMHTRYADNPLWLTEGMAMYFETPDLQNRSGWRTAGSVNRPRLNQFRISLSKRKPDALVSLIQSDSRFTDAQAMNDAYAEAWALSYFLIRTRKPTYVAYLKTISAKPVLTWGTPDDRLKEFRAAFGEDLRKLDAEFLKYLRAVK